LPPQESWAINGYWLYTAILKENMPIKRDELMSKLLKNGVETRPVFYPLHEMPPYKNYPTKSTFENSKFISKQGISFPSSVNITDAELNNIRSAFQVIFDSVKA
jgi:perosamine synthetase